MSEEKNYTYSRVLECKNCGFRKKYDIQLGECIYQFCSHEECTECGCKAFKDGE